MRRQKRILSFFRKLGNDDVVRVPHEYGQLGGRKRIFRFQCDPLRSSEIRRGNNAGPLGQLIEIVRRRFERQPDGRRLEDRVSEHLARYLEGQIAAPDHMFRDGWKRKTKVADPAGIHSANLKEKSLRDKNLFISSGFYIAPKSGEQRKAGPGAPAANPRTARRLSSAPEKQDVLSVDLL